MDIIMYQSIFIKENNISLELNDIKEKIDIKEEDIAFLSGSLIESIIKKTSKNMGNRLSDIDVFIITKNIESYNGNRLDIKGKRHKTLFRKINNINLDIEIYDEETIHSLINQLNKYEPTIINKKINSIIKPPEEIGLFNFCSFLHRMLNSICLYNENKYEILKDSVRWNLYYKFMTRLSINKVENMFDDIIGNLEVMEYEVALILARDMLLETIKAYIFYNKESVDRKKWISLKFYDISRKDLYTKELYDKFVELNFYNSIKSNSQYEENIKAIIRFSNKLIDEICLNSAL